MQGLKWIQDLLINILTILRQIFTNEVYLSAFLGFGSALLAEGVLGVIKNWKMKRELINELRVELREVNRIAQENSQKESKDIGFFLHPYIIAVWEGACMSNAILCLNKDKNYNKIMEVFERIKDANEFEKECFYQSFSHNDEKIWNLRKRMLRENREKVVKETDILLKLLNKGATYKWKYR